jgi:plasmid stabilization system protein ParE
MTKLRNSDTAIVDRVAAVKSIQSYFTKIQSPELGHKHTKIFRDEIKQKFDMIKAHPMMYRVRDNGPFLYASLKFRSFPVHWFIVFSTYEEADDEVIIWFIRSSKSDYSDIIYLDQTLSD